MKTEDRPDSDLTDKVREAVFGAMTEGAIAVDAQGVIIAINPTAQEAFGSTAAETLGHTIAELLSPWVESVDAYLDADETPEMLALSRDDEQRFFHWRAVPIEEFGGQLFLMRDVTELTRTEEARSEFISFVSHELRLPLTSIKGYADLILTGAVGPVSEPQTQFLNTIRSNVNRMADQIAYIVDISRIESGELYINPAPVSLRKAVEGAARSFEKKITEKELSFDVEIPPLPLVWADGKRLNQVIALLLANAVGYTPAGGEIAIRAALMDDGETVHISVTDNGAGIAPEDQQHIFEKFFRSDDQEIRNVAGIGLGLCIAKGLVEMHGGRMWFESAFREGSTFHFTLHTAEAAQAG
jgi:PAS domain S-box-containing protein